MSISERIIMLLNGREQKELTNALGLKETAFSEWKSRKSKSYKKYLVEIAEFFGVSIDYLVYGETKGDSADKIQKFDGRERELLRNFRRLPDNEKDQLIGRAQLMAEQAMKGK